MHITLQRLREIDPAAANSVQSMLADITGAVVSNFVALYDPHGAVCMVEGGLKSAPPGTFFVDLPA